MTPDAFARVRARLAANGEAVRALASGLGADQATWRPAPDAWSLLEVVCHLLDEEREDFRPRLDVTLHRPDEPFAPIDPEAWVTGRDYAGRDLATVLDAFGEERRASLAWLDGLGTPDWDAAHLTAGGHRLRAGDLLRSWAAHDHLHLRQLNELLYAYEAATASPFDVGYAGDW